jgi:hypothetical protein
MMKQIRQLIAVLLIVTVIFSTLSFSAHADGGSGNINGGGGSMGSGTGSNYWNNGDDGVRVTIVRASDNAPVSTPIDMTNRNESGIQKHFIKKSKLSYRSGSSLTVDTDQYSYTKPSSPLPTIITGDSTNNIPAIKAYFTDKLVIQYIASIDGVLFDTLTDGNYKLLLEPIAYFTFEGATWAMTATEAAKYDQLASGDLRAKMVSLSHQNLPLSMFLQTSDMGYPAYEGSSSRPQSDTMIINELGLGIVKFSDNGGNDNPPTPASYDATYRTNTDVVTSVTLSTHSQIDPDSPARVTFHILGSSFTRTSIVIPEGESQLVWVKWHTPSTPQVITITVSSSKGSLSDSSITANIVNLDEKTPPNPTATDRNDSFTLPDPPDPATSSSNSWSVWSADWFADMVWDEDWEWEDHPSWPSGGEWVDQGKWVDHGYWEYNNTAYRATLSANMDLEPDAKDPTADGKTMRSGYGVNINVSTNLSTSDSAANVAAAQNAVTYFPEFAYSTYWRVLDPTVDRFTSSFVIKSNIYSTYNDRVHFTPVWFPDGPYTAYTFVEDCWTPAGMLTAKLTDSTSISGSVFDDWHVGPKLND